MRHKTFLSAMSPLFALLGFVVGLASPEKACVLMLAAILFHMWSQEEN